MQQTTAFELVRNAMRNGRIPHAYCLVGDPRGDALALATRIASLLLCEKGGDEAPCGVCDACRRVAGGTHPDVFQIGPEKKSRVIGIEAMRETFLPWAAEKSFAGGWKVGMLLFADRLNPSAANAFLKTLEEPPAETLFLLLAPSVDPMLPTVVSRCQKIDLSSGRTPPPEPWRSLVGEILAAHSAESGLRVAATAARLHALFARITEDAEGEVAAELDAQKKAAQDPKEWLQPEKGERDAMVSVRAKERRQAIFQAIQEWYRDLFFAATAAEADAGRPAPSALCFPEHRDEIVRRAERLPVRIAIRLVDAAGRLREKIEDRNLPDQHVFLEAFSYLR